MKAIDVFSKMNQNNQFILKKKETKSLHLENN